MPKKTDDLNSKYFENRSYGRHETFYLRTGWLRKGFENIKNDPKFFTNPETIEILGVGKNMVNAIRYWSQVFDVVSAKEDGEGYEQNEFGRFLFKHDKYLEDPLSDWLLHHKLVTNYHLAPSFFWAFNLMSLREFNANSFIRSLEALHSKLGVKPIAFKTLQNDFQVFVQTYSDRSNGKKSGEDILDSPLSPLEMITHSNDRNQYVFRLGAKKDLPAEMVAYAILFQMAQRKSHQEEKGLSIFQINLESLLWEPFSPGMVFKLDSETLMSFLDEICQKNIIKGAQFSSSAGIKQFMVSSTSKTLPLDIIKSYYEVCV